MKLEFNVNILEEIWEQLIVQYGFGNKKYHQLIWKQKHWTSLVIPSYIEFMLEPENCLIVSTFGGWCVQRITYPSTKIIMKYEWDDWMMIWDHVSIFLQDDNMYIHDFTVSQSGFNRLEATQMFQRHRYGNDEVKVK